MTDPFTRPVPTLQQQQDFMVRDLETSWRLGETDPVRYPVIYAPSGEVIGSATTEHGALNCVARRCSKRSFERWTANCQERIGADGTVIGLAWFTGPQLIQGGK